jgi:hypothetical protein
VTSAFSFELSFLQFLVLRHAIVNSDTFSIPGKITLITPSLMKNTEIITELSHAKFTSTSHTWFLTCSCSTEFSNQRILTDFYSAITSQEKLSTLLSERSPEFGPNFSQDFLIALFQIGTKFLTATSTVRRAVAVASEVVDGEWEPPAEG